MNVKLTLQRINDYLNNLPQTVRSSPRDEQIAYYTIFVGIALLIVGVFVKALF